MNRTELLVLMLAEKAKEKRVAPRVQQIERKDTTPHTQQETKQ